MMMTKSSPLSGMPSAQASGSAGLRSRKIDFKKSLAVFRFTDLDDIDEDNALNRTIPTIATGVEKEEEEVTLLIKGTSFTTSA